MTEGIEHINGTISGIIWGPAMLALFLAVGMIISAGTGFFQISRFGLWMKTTIISALGKRSVRKTSDKKSISQFQALTTALAGTLGTGNIAGVATAIFWGGPGAVFWMWVSAALGMMISFAEKTLAVRYRYKNVNGDWIGGAMVYIERGLGCRWLAAIFAVFCVLASLGSGNMTQSNSMASAFENSLGIAPMAVGLAVSVLTGFVIIGGIKRIASVSEKLIPALALFYIAGGIAVIAGNIENLPSALGQILGGAFDFRAVGGGAAGYGIAQAMRYGIARGVFSNEAGLGSSCMVHAAADVKEPAVQGMWGIFEVFADTILTCSITALAILTAGVYDGSVALKEIAKAADGFYEIPSSLTGAALTMKAFSTVFGDLGGIFISASLTLFAFSSLLGWSYYGERGLEYLTGSPRFNGIYKGIFLTFIVIGAVSRLDVVWNISDATNGLMALPNLIALLFLSPKVFAILKSYIRRKTRVRPRMPF